MTPHTPPRWLERVLILLLPPHDGDTVSGDLSEAYAEARSRRGALSANLWYARQVVSFGPHRFSLPERMLAGLSLFAVLYGCWFGVMEALLRHPGYLRRDGISLTILWQACVTLLFLLLRGRPRLGYLVAIGCLPLLFLVSLVARGLLAGAGLEGYVIVMALSLAVQAMLTIVVLIKRSTRNSHVPHR